MINKGIRLLGVVIAIALGLSGFLYYTSANNIIPSIPLRDEVAHYASTTPLSAGQATENPGTSTESISSSTKEPADLIPTTTTHLELREEAVPPDDRNVYYLRSGTIWTADLKDGKRFAVVTTGGDISKFALSPDKQYLYWINEQGDLWKQNVANGSQPIALITTPGDTKESSGSKPDEAAPQPSPKGQVVDFWLSPDGNYIAYKSLDGYTACCEAESGIPTGILNVMQTDGSGRIQIRETNPDLRKLISPVIWTPDSSKIVFSSQEPDQAMQGDPYRSVDRDGTHLARFMDFYNFYELAGAVIGVVRTEPRFSPDGRGILHLNGVGDEPTTTVWLYSPDDSKQKKLLDINGAYFLFHDDSPQWSSDSSEILIATNRQIYLFDKDGELIAKSRPSESFDCAWCSNPRNDYEDGYGSTILAPDNATVWGTYNVPSKEDQKATKVLFSENLIKGERNEYRLDISPQSGIRLELRSFSEGKLYYETRNIFNKQIKPSLYVFDPAVQKNYLIAEDVSQVVPIE